ncbi:hypothetical protein GQ44DRAFT_561885, partial [Phaeosphaeriaceae sp. PMI808]
SVHGTGTIRFRVRDTTIDGQDMELSGASTSLTPQLAVILSCCVAPTSNAKVVVLSARLSREFTQDGFPQ